MGTHDGVVVVKKAGHEVPPLFLASVFAENDSAFGVAVIRPTETGNDTELVDFHAEGHPELSNITTMLSENKDNSVVMFFGKKGLSWKPEDIPPYTIATTGGEEPEILVTSFVEGEFPGYIDPTSDRWDGALAIDGYIKEVVADVYLELGENEGPSDFMRKLDESKMTKNIRNCIGSRGSVTILAYNGEFLNVAKNGLGKDFDWGFSTYITNDKEEALALGKVPEKEKPVLSLPKEIAKGKKQIAGITPIKANGEKKGSVPNTAVLAKAAASDEAGDWVTMRPGPEIKGNDATRAWYETYTGKVPNDYKERPAVPVKIPKGKSLKDFKAMAAKLEGTPIPQATPEQQAAIRAASIVPAEEKKRLHDVTLPRIFDRVNKRSMTPEQIAEEEKLLPTALEIMGKTPEDLLRWNFEDRKQLAHDCPATAALLIGNLINELADSQNEDDDDDTGTTPEAKAAQAEAEVKAASQAGKTPAQPARRRAIM